MSTITASMRASHSHSTPATETRSILVSVPTGFQLRQFVHSGVVSALREQGMRVTVVSPNKPGQGFTSSLTGPGMSFRSLDPNMGPIRHRYFLARQHLLLQQDTPETLQQKLVELRRTHPVVANFATVGRALIGYSPALRRYALDQEHLMFRDRETNNMFRQEKPDLVLLGSPGFIPQDAFLLHAASRLRIPVIAAVLSWDNLSSKGLINPRPDKLLVWSEHMRREAIEFQGFDESRICVTGAIVHDVFANADRLGSREDNFRRLGLDPSRKLIVYGTNHGGFFPDEVEVVKAVARWVERDELGERSQLWVRLHPQAVSGPFAVDTDEYRKLESSLVRIEFPPLRKSQMLWEFPKSDLYHLVKLLRDADVVINSGSLSVDTAVLDRPIVCVGYDPSGEVPYDRSVSRFYKFTHMSHIVGTGGVRVATSAADLHSNILRYLADPALEREGRRAIVEQQFGLVDGRSAERTVATIVETLANDRRRKTLRVQ